MLATDIGVTTRVYRFGNYLIERYKNKLNCCGGGKFRCFCIFENNGLQVKSNLMGAVD